MLKLEYLKSFKKDYKRIKKRGYDISLLERVITMLANQQQLPPKYRDHALTGNYAGFRECHIRPDWLLVYRIDSGILTLTLSRTGTHTELFD